MTSFLSELRRPANVAKDPEADRMIRDAVSANPDAVDLLVQHGILSDQALNEAQTQISRCRPRR